MGFEVHNIEEEVKDYDHYLQQFDIKQSTRNVYTNAVKKLLRSVEKVTQYNVNTFLKDHARHYYRTAIRHYLKYRDVPLEGKGSWDVISITVKPPKPQERPSHDEWKDLFNKIEDYKDVNKDFYWTSVLLFYTGARIHEVLSLQMKHLDPDACKVTFVKTKTDKPRKIRLPDEVMSELYSYLIQEKGLLEEERCFYKNYSKTRYAYVAWREEVDMMVIKGVLSEKEGRLMKRSHNFRRSFTDLAYELTGDILSVAEVRGDSDIKTTRRYISQRHKELAAEDTMDKMIDKLEGGSE